MALPDPDEVLAQARGATQEPDKPAPELPPDTTIEVDYRDARGKPYKGSFHYEVPTLGDQIDIGKMKSTYLPMGSPADVNAAALVETICYLTVCIKFDERHPKPSWWQPLKARDAGPYTELYGRCLEYEARFHGGRAEREGDEGELRERDESGGDDSLRLGGEVPPPPKRSTTLAGDGA